MKRIATPMVGGVVTSTLLELLVYPVISLMWRQRSIEIMDAQEPESNNSSRPEFWDVRYAAGQTPWDFHGVPAALREFLETSQPGSVLIPGCGAGYEVRAFDETGWKVTAIDFSPVAVERARSELGALA